ncbi:MAG: sulfotransferase family 2 domain-containing protein [Pseudomonadota bacterium]
MIQEHVEVRTRLLANYAQPAHFLQNCYVPRKAPSGGSFVYIKMHKAASTTVLATLATHIHRERALDAPELNFRAMHKGPSEAFHIGRRFGIDKMLAKFESQHVFCFTLIRDPYARVVSAWANKISHGGRTFRALRQAIGRKSRRHMPLREFLAVLAEDPRARDADRHWRPQWKEGAFDTLSYDFIGDAGRLHESMAIVTERTFGEPAPRIADTRESLGHATGSSRLLTTLTDQDRAHIETAYGDDIKLFARVAEALDHRTEKASA